VDISFSATYIVAWLAGFAGWESPAGASRPESCQAVIVSPVAPSAIAFKNKGSDHRVIVANETRGRPRVGGHERFG
jgi:hypothetical protein